MSEHTKRMKRLYGSESDKRAPWQDRLNQTLKSMRKAASNTND